MRSISSEDFVISEADILEAIVGIEQYIRAMYPNGCTICGILDGVRPLLEELEARFALDPKRRHLYRFTTVAAKSYMGEDQKEKIGIFNVPSTHLLSKRDVLIIDDVIDTGKTIKAVGKIFMEKLRANHVRVAALCVKGELPEWVDAAAVGFQLPKNQFIVGFGMDYSGTLRELREIRPLTDEERRAEKGTTEIVEEEESKAEHQAGAEAGSAA